MVMPTQIKGICIDSKHQARPISLTLDADSLHRPGIQGFYSDEQGNQWYTKSMEAEHALREMAAGAYFKTLVNDEYAADTKFLRDTDGNYFLLSAVVDLQALSTESKYTNLVLLLVASFLIGDTGCNLENIKEVNQLAYRIDFGAALYLTPKDNEEITFLISAKEINQAFPIEQFRQQLNVEDYHKIVAQLTDKVLTTSFDWASWSKLADSLNIPSDFDIQSELIKTRAQALKQHFTEQSHESCADNQLTGFYSLLKDEVLRSDDLLLVNIPSATLASRHLHYQACHGQPPIFYTYRFQEAERKFFSHMLETPLFENNNIITPLDYFILNNINKTVDQAETNQIQQHSYAPVFTPDTLAQPKPSLGEKILNYTRVKFPGW